MVHDTDIRIHPAVHVADQRHHDLRSRERAVRLHGDRLTHVEAPVLGRRRVDVVQDSVAVLQRVVLPRLHAEHVGRVLAALLV